MKRIDGMTDREYVQLSIIIIVAIVGFLILINNAPWELRHRLDQLEKDQDNIYRQFKDIYESDVWQRGLGQGQWQCDKWGWTNNISYWECYNASIDRGFYITLNTSVWQVPPVGNFKCTEIYPNRKICLHEIWGRDIK